MGEIGRRRRKGRERGVVGRGRKGERQRESERKTDLIKNAIFFFFHRSNVIIIDTHFSVISQFYLTVWWLCCTVREPGSLPPTDRPVQLHPPPRGRGFPGGREGSSCKHAADAEYPCRGRGLHGNVCRLRGMVHYGSYTSAPLRSSKFRQGFCFKHIVLKYKL